MGTYKEIHNLARARARAIYKHTIHTDCFVKLVAAGLTRFTANPSESCPAVAPDVPVTVDATPSVQAGRVVTLVDVCNMTSQCGC